jgi:hypothetical protein
MLSDLAGRSEARACRLHAPIRIAITPAAFEAIAATLRGESYNDVTLFTLAAPRSTR